MSAQPATTAATPATGPAVGDIHRYVPGTSGTTLLVLHGTGGNEDDLLPLATRLLPGAPLLAPRGPVLENGMPRYFRRLEAGVFDQDDLRRRTGELADFLRSAATRYAFDPSRVIALGYSNGANIAASLLLTDPEPLHAAVLIRAQLPFEPKVVPQLSGKSVYLAAGTYDEYTSSYQVEELASQLRSGGAEVTVAWAEAGHGLTNAELEPIASWLADFRT